MDKQLESNAWKYWEHGQYLEALPLFQQLYLQTTNTEDKLDILDAIAGCYVEMKDYDNTITTFFQVLDTAPDSIDTLANLGKVFLMQKNYAKAMEFYEKAFVRGNTDDDDLMQLARLYSRHQKIEKALETLDTLLLHHPNHAPAYEAIGYFEAERQNYVKAFPAYQKALALDPDNPRLVQAAILLMINMRDFDMAKRAIAMFREDNPEDAYLLYYLALTEYHTGKSKAAIEHLKQAVAIQPSLSQAQELLRTIQ